VLKGFGRTLPGERTSWSDFSTGKDMFLDAEELKSDERNGMGMEDVRVEGRRKLNVCCVAGNGLAVALVKVYIVLMMEGKEGKRIEYLRWILRQFARESKLRSRLN
jgi:hypothetical protein